MDTDGYDISEVRGHLRFSSPSFYPSSPPRRSFFYFNSIFLPVLFPYYLVLLVPRAHVTLSLFLRSPLDRPWISFYFALRSLSRSLSRRRVASTRARNRAFISCRSSLAPFPTEPFVPRQTARTIYNKNKSKIRVTVRSLIEKQKRVIALGFRLVADR